MAGIVPDRVREEFGLPENCQAFTALAIGYEADPGQGPEELRQRDEGSRGRRALSEFVFGSEWGTPAGFTGQ